MGQAKTRKNYLHGKAPNKQKKNKEIFLGFLFRTTTSYSRKKNKKEAENIFGFTQSFSNTQEEGERNKLTWIIQWKGMNTDNLNECVMHECNVGEKYVLLQA